MMRIDEASDMTGVSPSAKTSIIASEFGVVVEPMIASTLFSLISFFVFCTAVVVSVASSSRMYSMVLPATLLGHRGMVFFSGMPREAAGPVAETVTPTLTCATAVVESETSAAAKTKPAVSFIDFSLFRERRMITDAFGPTLDRRSGIIAFHPTENHAFKRHPARSISFCLAGDGCLRFGAGGRPEQGAAHRLARHRDARPASVQRRPVVPGDRGDLRGALRVGLPRVGAYAHAGDRRQSTADQRRRIDLDGQTQARRLFHRRSCVQGQAAGADRSGCGVLDHALDRPESAPRRLSDR